MEEFLKEIIAGAGGGILAGIGMFKFLGKSWIKNRFGKNLENAKTELDLYASQKKALRAKEYEVCPEIWKKLIDLQYALKAYTAIPGDPEEEKQKKSKAAHRAYWDFKKHLDYNGIFLNPVLKSDLEEIDIKFYEIYSQKINYEATFNTKSEDNIEFFKRCDSEINTLKAKIESLIQQKLFPEEAA